MENDVEISRAVALTTFTLYSGVLALQVNPKYLAPFNQAIMIIGGNMLFSTTILSTFDFNRFGRFDQAWAKSNLAALITLLTFLFFAASYECVGLRNTAFVYSLIWIFSKYVEILTNLVGRLIFGNKELPIIIFSAFVVVYYLTQAIEKNPGFISSLFSHPIPQPDSLPTINSIERVLG